MPKLLGIDLGTSSVKAAVIDESGAVLGTGAREISLSSPQSGWAEQDPAEWWTASRTAVRACLARAGVRDIDAIGLSGQMHGTVLLDVERRLVRPAVIWADRRSGAQAEQIREMLGLRLMQVTGTAPSAGFTASTLLWLREHEPESLSRAVTCLLPKDHLRLLLTGSIATDPTDASGTGLFDIERRAWSSEVIMRLALPEGLFPAVVPSEHVAGELTPEAGAALGLRPGIPVVAGCADQPAQAIGNGLVGGGAGSITIGTGGQVFIGLDNPVRDPELRLHVFCHAPAQRWYMLGAMLAAGLSLRWLRDLLGLSHDHDAYARLDALAGDVQPGAGGLLFLPYLAGERAPVMDPRASGAFVGLTLEHGRAEMARSVMEGVAFALRQILETARRAGAEADRLVASGNGLQGGLWRQIVADVLDTPLSAAPGLERAAAGAALVAGIGAGVFPDYSALPTQEPAEFEVTQPDPDRVAIYNEYYRSYLRIYPSLSPLMHDLHAPKSDLGE